MERKHFQEVGASIIVATLSLFIIPISYLLLNPIPADIYETFRLFDIYNPLSMVAYFWIQNCIAGTLFGVVNWAALKLSQNRPISAGILLSIPTIVFFFTLLLGSGKTLSSYRWLFIIGLVFIAP